MGSREAVVRFYGKAAQELAARQRLLSLALQDERTDGACGAGDRQIGFSRDRLEVCGTSKRLPSASSAPHAPRQTQACPDHDGDIGNVEHSGPKRPNTDSEEVHDAAPE